MTVFTAFVFQGVKYGAGQHHSDIPLHDIGVAMKVCHITRSHACRSDNNTLQSYWFCELFFIAAGMAIKASIGVMLLRLAVSKMHRWIIFTSIAFTEIYSCVFLFIFIFQCNPSRYFWTNLTGSEGSCLDPQVIVGTFYGYTAVACITDWTFAILPAILVKGLQMNSREKVSVVLILSMGVLASIASIARIPYVSAMANRDDFLYAVSDTAIWTGVEIGLGVLAACCATLRPLLRQLLPSLGFLSSGGRSRSTTHLQGHSTRTKEHNKGSSKATGDVELAGVRGNGLDSAGTKAWHHLEDDRNNDTGSNHSRTMIIDAKTSIYNCEENTIDEASIK